MKFFGFLMAALVLSAPPLTFAADSPVVVELFTSEGCSSCPPADALLIQLSQAKARNGADILVLGEHVDYWNSSNWTDRFSSVEFTERQQSYARRFHLASPYTPQMVVDGSVQFVGNNQDNVYQAISSESEKPKAAAVSLSLENEKTLHISVHTSDPNKSHVILAITEDGLASNVKGGENGGRTLRHAGVVRVMRDCGSLSGGNFDREVQLPMKSDWNPANLKAVVFVQQTNYGPILGSASVRLAH